MSDDLHFLELTALAGLIRTRQVSPVEVTRVLLDRIVSCDSELHSFALVTPDVAMAQARAAEEEIAKGRYRGPLHGVPVGIKDLCWTKGLPTACGMPILRDFVPDEDGTVVVKLREAGAVMIGKTQMTEGAFANHHPDIPAPVNPWHADLWPGVSSSGSGVATAAGLCYGAIGSDTGGSIRFPSAANGLTGLKPTWGRVSRHGAFELAATLDHLGPMTRSTADAAAMLGAMAGRDPKDPTSRLEPVPDYLGEMGRGLSGLTLGLDEAWNGLGADEPTKSAMAGVLAALQGTGATIRPVKVPESGSLVDAWSSLCGIEAAYAHRDTYPSRKAEYGPVLSGLLDLGRSLNALDYQRIVLDRIAFTGAMNALFASIDLLVCPAQTLAGPTNDVLAGLAGDPEMLAGMLRFTCPFDMSGHPTITLPCGQTAAGAPVGFQFVAGHMKEDLLFRAGHAYQSVTDWHRRHPARYP
jgi:amidase